jgi:hypothetical protein
MCPAATGNVAESGGNVSTRRDQCDGSRGRCVQWWRSMCRKSGAMCSAAEDDVTEAGGDVSGGGAFE